MKRKKKLKKLVSILYKYHISRDNYILDYLYKYNQVSILYKYHISLQEFLRKLYKHTLVSILYKYHISLTKYSTFWTLIDKNIEK